MKAPAIRTLGAGLWAAAARLRAARGGASGIEYALLAGMVAVILGMFVLGIQSSVKPIFNNLAAGLGHG